MVIKNKDMKNIYAIRRGETDVNKNGKYSGRTDIIADRKRLGELELALKEKSVRFEVVFEDEWKKKFNEMMS